jgi:hypothetical protein
MYKALMHPGIPADNNKKIWKIKIPLKTEFFGWYLHRVIRTKDKLVRGLDMRTGGVYFVIMMR